MSSLIHQVVEIIQDEMGQLSGIKSAPDYLPETQDAFPFIIAYEGPGLWKKAVVGEMQSMATIKVELHVARKELPRDQAQAVYYSDLIPKAIYARFDEDQLGGTVSAIGEIQSSGLTFISYQTENDHLGYVFTVEGIKIRTNLT